MGDSCGESRRSDWDDNRIYKHSIQRESVAIVGVPNLKVQLQGCPKFDVALARATKSEYTMLSQLKQTGLIMIPWNLYTPTYAP